MNAPVENEKLRDMIKKANLEFSYKDVFECDGEDIDIGATALITSNQIVTIINVGEGEQKLHYVTQNTILQAIYDLPNFPSQIVTNTTHEYQEYRERAITFTIRNIAGSKIIWIKFPKRITQGQLKMLNLYKRLYGKEIDACAREYFKTAGEILIGIEGEKDSEDICECERFDEVIRYAKAKKKTQTVIKEKFIVGYQEESIRKNAIRVAKDNGITGEECAEIAKVMTAKRFRGVSKDE